MVLYAFRGFDTNTNDEGYSLGRVLTSWLATLAPPKKAIYTGFDGFDTNTNEQFGGVRLLTSRLAGTLAPPKKANCTTTGLRDSAACASQFSALHREPIFVA